MFKKLMQALFGRQEPEPKQTIGQRLEEMQRERELRESQSPQRRPIGKHRTPPARTSSPSRPDDSLSHPLHPLGVTSPISPLNTASHYSQDHTPSPARDSCSNLSSSYDSGSSYSGSSSCDSGSSSSSSDGGSY